MVLNPEGLNVCWNYNLKPTQYIEPHKCTHTHPVSFSLRCMSGSVADQKQADPGPSPSTPLISTNSCQSDPKSGRACTERHQACPLLGYNRGETRQKQVLVRRAWIVPEVMNLTRTCLSPTWPKTEHRVLNPNPTATQQNSVWHTRAQPVEQPYNSICFIIIGKQNQY